MAQCLALMGSGGAVLYVGEYRPEKQVPAAAALPKCGGRGIAAADCLPPFMMAAMQSQFREEPLSCFVVAAGTWGSHHPNLIFFEREREHTEGSTATKQEANKI